MLIPISLFLLILLLFFPEISLAGSQYGVTLWLVKLLPTLLPFFMAIKLFQLSLPNLSAKRPFLLTGLLCGYPTGAALVTYQYQRGYLNRRKAHFYLGFVNNPSPMFVLVFCGVHVLGLSMKESVTCFIILILASLSGSLLFYLLLTVKESRIPESAQKEINNSEIQQKTSPDTETKTMSEQIDSVILDSFILMIKIGGYVILFSILGQWLHHVISGNSPVQYVLRALGCSLLEITSGVSFLKDMALPSIAKKVLTITVLTFGGLSAAAQTSSILAKSGLSVPLYLINKGLNSFLALLLASLVFYVF